MNRTKNALLAIFFLSSINAMAHGEKIIMTFLIHIVVVLALLIFIGFLKWKITGKILLLFMLIISVFFTNTILGSIPYKRYVVMINILSAVIPLLSVLSVFLLFRKKFLMQN
jgi:hypothetical protein